MKAFFLAVTMISQIGAPPTDWAQRLHDLGAPPVAAECCKMCSKGKACGDSCIKRTYNCTKDPGCACDSFRPETSMPKAENF